MIGLSIIVNGVCCSSRTTSDPSLTAASLELDFCPAPAGWVLVPVVNPRHAGNRADCA